MALPEDVMLWYSVHISEFHTDTTAVTCINQSLCYASRAVGKSCYEKGSLACAMT